MRGLNLESLLASGTIHFIRVFWCGIHESLRPLALFLRMSTLGYACTLVSCESVMQTVGEHKHELVVLAAACILREPKLEGCS